MVIKIALGTAILLIVYITGLFFMQMQNIGESFDSMSVSNKRLLKIEKIFSAVTLNESSVRSYIISKDSTYLRRRFTPQEKLNSEFKDLRKLSVGNADNRSCDSLQALVNQRFILFKKILEYTAANPQHTSETIADIMAESDAVSDKIRDLAHDLLEDEVLRMNKYEIAHKYDVDTSVITSFLLVTIALFILLVSLNRISSDLKNLKNLNDELQFLNHTFSNAEKIAGMSHWKYNLATRRYSFSDNFYNQIGRGYDAAQLGLKSIIARLHPEDRERVTQVYDRASREHKSSSVIYRLISKNGDTKHIKSVMSYAENSQGEVVEIGVNYDITEQQENTISLEQNNRELRDINTELESFNNIVSHDLQEPLRKIQMFISRIDERESQNLSDAGKDYFNKIKLCANRMQNLLIDLVNYSRTMKGERNFEIIHLGEILENVLAELALNIEERGAVVNVKTLPTANVIPFQIHQLFINLITNSLKFSRQGINPAISITAQELETNEIIDGKLLNPREWHKIVVVDNGIGFRPEFADKIFQLFRRLEKDIDYSGTGIGLAICKKIIENHKGHIIAEGHPGKGATFIIYLPK